jgi:hypothetical protein
MPLNVVPSNFAIQYTGSNGTAIDAAVSPYIDFVIVSESSGQLTWNSNGGANVVTSTGEWILWNVNNAFMLSNALYVKEWMCTALCSELTSTNNAVGELDDSVNTLSTNLTGAFVRSMGVAPVPTLILNGTATVAVQLQPAMPDSGYAAYASKFAGVSVTDLQINSVTVVDADTVNVAVENVGLATITGASVLVHAID